METNAREVFDNMKIIVVLVILFFSSAICATPNQIGIYCGDHYCPSGFLCCRSNLIGLRYQCYHPLSKGCYADKYRSARNCVCGKYYGCCNGVCFNTGNYLCNTSTGKLVQREKKTVSVDEQTVTKNQRNTTKPKLPRRM